MPTRHFPSENRNETTIQPIQAIPVFPMSSGSISLPLPSTEAKYREVV